MSSLPNPDLYVYTGVYPQGAWSPGTHPPPPAVPNQQQHHPAVMTPLDYQPPTHNRYTAHQQDLQARNRPTHAYTGGRGAGYGGSALLEAQLVADETFEEREKRSNAARILESNEMLIWWSYARNESIPQTRLHFEKVVAGIESDESDKEWENSNEEETAETRGSPRPRPRGDRPRKSGGAARPKGRAAGA